MPDDKGGPALLVVSPDIGLDTFGGERIRKLTSAFDEQGWRLIGLAPPERDYLSSHARWPDSLVVHRSLVSTHGRSRVFVKRRLRGREVTPTPTADRRRSAASRPVARRADKGRPAPAVAVPVGRLGAVCGRTRRGPCEAGRPVAIFSSFPPTASHLVALTLHRLTGLPWIADSRDPWAWGIEHGYVWARRNRVTAQAEATVLRNATALTTMGPSLGAELAERASGEVVLLPHLSTLPACTSSSRSNGAAGGAATCSPGMPCGSTTTSPRRALRELRAERGADRRQRRRVAQNRGFGVRRDRLRRAQT